MSGSTRKSATAPLMWCVRRRNSTISSRSGFASPVFVQAVSSWPVTWVVCCSLAPQSGWFSVMPVIAKKKTSANAPIEA